MIKKSNQPLEQHDEVRMLDVEELASRLGLSVRGVWRLVSLGKLPKPKKLGRSARWSLSVIKKWMDEGCPDA